VFLLFVLRDYEFLRFGAVDVTNPYECIGFVTKSYEFIRFGAQDVTKPYEFKGFGAQVYPDPGYTKDPGVKGSSLAS
jgi:hypothetical protein